MNNIFNNAQEVISQESLDQKLRSDKKLVIKLGVDPTKPDLHLGHVVVLKKLKEFQDLGHKIIFLIGDYTTKIGDPSGRSETRPTLTDEEIEKNTKTYLDQVGKILDLTDVEIKKNSEWFSKMTFAQILSLLSLVTVSNIIERDDFKKRLSTGLEVAMSELLYPVMQGYDSVMLKSDVELGGQDQKLNMLMGRELQKKFSQAPQDILTMPLLVGTDGKKKMSKSLGNYIAINEDPSNQFGKLMSIPDELIEDYLRLVSTFTKEEVSQILKKMSDGENPRNIKEEMAINIVSWLSSKEEAVEASEQFRKVFSENKIPQNIETLIIEEKINIVDLLVKLDFASSRSEAQRLIKQNAVKIEEQVIDSPAYIIEPGLRKVLRVGKLRFVKLG